MRPTLASSFLMPGGVTPSSFQRCDPGSPHAHARLQHQPVHPAPPPRPRIPGLAKEREGDHGSQAFISGQLDTR